MLPPISKAVLAANPQFQALYEHTCLSKLDGDGASKLDEKSATERRVFEQSLYQARFRAAQQDLLVDTLYATVHRDGVTEQDQQLITIIGALLDGRLSAEHASITYDAVQSFKTALPHLAPLLAEQLQHNADIVRQLLDAENRSVGHQQVILKTREKLEQSRTALAELKASSMEQALTLHRDYRAIIELCIRFLEQTVHGSEARAVKAKIEYLTTVAEGMAKKAGVQNNQLLTHVDNASGQVQLLHALQSLRDEDREVRASCSEHEARLELLQKQSGEAGSTLLSLMAELHGLKYGDTSAA